MQAFRTGAGHRGVTLVELAIVMAIGGLLAGLGWPLFTRQQATAAVTAAASRTLAALQHARTQALASGQSVTVCPTPDGRRCGFAAGDHAASAWMLFENRESGLDSSLEPGDRLLQSWWLPGNVQVGGTRGFAAYQPTPRSAATLRFDFCHRRHPDIRRGVIVSQTGRPRVSRPLPASTRLPAHCP